MGDTYYENLGTKIRASRKVKHISLSHVAQHLNKSLSTVAKYETGEIAIDVESLHKLCSYLGINISDLIPDSVSMYPAEDIHAIETFSLKNAMSITIVLMTNGSTGL